MPKIPLQSCLPTGGTKVPAGPDWLHEIKYDGYRLIVQREGKGVRLLTRNGYEWSDRYPLIVGSALRNRRCDGYGSSNLIGPISAGISKLRIILISVGFS